MGLLKTYDLAVERVEVVIDEAVFVCRHFDQSSVEWQKVYQRVVKPYRRHMRNDSLPPEKDRELSITCFVETCLLDWRNVRLGDDDPEIAFSKEAAISLFLRLPRLYADVAAEAADMSRFRANSLDNAVKN